MSDLDTLKNDELWLQALRLGKVLMHLGYAEAKFSEVICQTLRNTATAIPRAVGDAHLAENMEMRMMHLDRARREARDLETILTSAASEEGADLSSMVEAFMLADALRERLLLAQREEQEMRLSA